MACYFIIFGKNKTKNDAPSCSNNLGVDCNICIKFEYNNRY